jgi:hypothetical protein
MTDHYTDMHRRADILAYRAARRRMLAAMAWATAGAIIAVGVLHDAPARVAETVWQAENGRME